MEARETEKKLEYIGQILKTVGFELEKDQPHMQGERFLMMKDKFVLVGRQQKDGLRVIIKTSNNPLGKKEIALMITELEAYDGFDDRASHASRGRTERNKIIITDFGSFA